MSGFSWDLRYVEAWSMLTSTLWRAAISPTRSGTGCPAPLMQPPGQAITSTRSYPTSSPATMRFTRGATLFRPDHRHPHGRAARGDGRLLEALEPPHLLEVQLVEERLTGELLHGHPQGGLRDAARGAEEDPGAGDPGVGGIELRRLDVLGLQAQHLHHLDELRRRQDGVHVADPLGSGLRPSGFVLLRQARHDRHHVEVVEADARLLGEVVLHRGARHHLGRLAARQVRDHLRVAALDEVHPARACLLYTSDAADEED